MATAKIKIHPIFWFQKHIKKSSLKNGQLCTHLYQNENHVYHGGLASSLTAASLHQGETF